MSGFIKADEIQEKKTKPVSHTKRGCIHTMTLVGKLVYSELTGKLKNNQELHKEHV